MMKLRVYLGSQTREEISDRKKDPQLPPETHSSAVVKYSDLRTRSLGSNLSSINY